MDADDAYFHSPVSDLFLNKEKSKSIESRISGELFLTNLTIHGFDEQKWEYWTAPNGTAPCDSCEYHRDPPVPDDGTPFLHAERYYGGFSARITSLSAKLNVKVDGEDAKCDLVGLTLRKDSVAHHRLGNQSKVYDNLDYFRLFFDINWYASENDSIEIKEWYTLDDWHHLGSRFFLEKMKDNSTWDVPPSEYHSPLIHMYVDPACLNLSYPQMKYFNRALSTYLDYQIRDLIADKMLNHLIDTHEKNWIPDGEEEEYVEIAVQGGKVEKPKSTTKKPTKKPTAKPTKTPKAKTTTKPSKKPTTKATTTKKPTTKTTKKPGLPWPKYRQICIEWTGRVCRRIGNALADVLISSCIRGQQSKKCLSRSDSVSSTISRGSIGSVGSAGSYEDD